MMRPERVVGGKIRIPVRLDHPDGAVGEGWADIGPEHPDFQKWDEHLAARMAAEARESAA